MFDSITTADFNFQHVGRIFQVKIFLQVVVQACTHHQIWNSKVKYFSLRKVQAVENNEIN